MPNPCHLRDWTDSLRVNGLEAGAERFFVRLMMKADDYGRHSAELPLLRAGLFPLLVNVRDTDITRWLAACEKAGLVRCYHGNNSRKYVEILQFNQRKKWMKAEHPPPEGQMPLLHEEPKPRRSRSRDELSRVEEEARVAENNPESEEGKGRALPIEEVEKGLDRINKINGIPTKAGGTVLEIIRERLNGVYKRLPGDGWSYAEESGLVDVCKRAEAAGELEHILVLRKSMPVEDRRRFFPQSINSLLMKWTEVLDKARVQVPLAPKVEGRRLKVEGEKMEGASRAPVNVAMLKESLAFMLKRNPEAPMVATLREQIAAAESVGTDGPL